MRIFIRNFFQPKRRPLFSPSHPSPLLTVTPTQPTQYTLKQWLLPSPMGHISYFSSSATTLEKTHANDTNNSTAGVIDLSLGQPTIKSHGEFFTSPDEIIPHITREEFRTRRSNLTARARDTIARKSSSTFDLFSGSEINNLIIVPAASKKYMSENIPYPFRQNSSFAYLTGCYDPDAFLVLADLNGQESHALFLRNPDSLSDLWDGPKTSPKGAVHHFGLDMAFLASDFRNFFKEFSTAAKNSVVVWCEDTEFAQALFATGSSFPKGSIHSPKFLIDQMRIIKSPGEIELLKISARIASIAFQRTMGFCKQMGQALTEHQIWAKLDYEMRVMGAERLAYPPVVASGDRANIIHYVFNSNKCNIKDMVLVDAGCEFFGYCSDITRTFPVSGKFTNDRQQSLYEMLLERQIDLIKQVEPGITLDQLYRTMGIGLAKGMQELGIIHGDVGSKTVGYADLILKFCPHHVSHHLGMDVHDSPSIQRNEPLEPGMCITMEPGIYIRPCHSDILTKAGREFIGLAIRIEDDLIVTDTGNQVLTSACPKTPSEFEYWANYSES